MTLVQLAQEVGITAQSLSNAECGRQDPSPSTLDKISEVLGFPVAFFGSPDLNELLDVQVSFRARSKTPAKAKNAVRGSARLAVELQRWIDERFVVPTVSIPTVDRRMSPEIAAEHVRSRWGLDLLRPISNCIHLMETKGIAIYSLPPEFTDVDAFSFWWREKPFVMLSTIKSAERSRFDAAHELGHLVMHRDDEYGRDWRTVEREANQFASAFLMPRDSVFQNFSRPATTDRIIRSKARWRVAALALAYRLHELKILTDWSYRQVLIELGRLGYRSGEPQGIVRETSQLLGKVLSAMRKEGTSLAGISRDLSVTADELKSLTFGLVVRSAGGPDEILGSEMPAGAVCMRLRLVSN